jgi:hypothetical protein
VFDFIVLTKMPAPNAGHLIYIQYHLVILYDSGCCYGVGTSIVLSQVINNLAIRNGSIFIISG